MTVNTKQYFLSSTKYYCHKPVFPISRTKRNNRKTNKNVKNFISISSVICRTILENRQKSCDTISDRSVTPREHVIEKLCGSHSESDTSYCSLLTLFRWYFLSFFISHQYKTLLHMQNISPLYFIQGSLIFFYMICNKFGIPCVNITSASMLKS